MTAMINMHSTRETWLLAAVELLRPLLKTSECELKAPVKVSIGVGTKKAIGFCYNAECAHDKVTRHVFICARLTDTTEVLATLLHELVHAGLPDGVKHGKPFRTVVRALGLAGKPTATYAEKDSPLHKQLLEIAEQLGEYPHVGLNPVRKKDKPPAGGWIKYVSKTNPEEYYLRLSPKSLEMGGAPTDPWGDVMVAEDELGMEDDDE